ncbi:MAG: hypothetical protein IH605_13355 [Burkholderiales bacterium]|nr:hypothetical protein [Burkholderiales bacterium]
MNSAKKIAPIVVVLAFCLALSAPTVASAKEVDGAIAACLKAWGDHPFGSNPQFKTLDTSVKVFGIGSISNDKEPTSSPSLVLVKPIYNVIGGATVELLNPNGWYCLKTALSVMGRLSIRVQCKAHLAMTSDGKTVLGDNTENRAIRDIGVTSIGSITVERPCD